MISTGGNIVEKLRFLFETPITAVGTAYIPLPSIPTGVYKAELYFLTNNNGQVSYNSSPTGISYNARTKIPLGQLEIPLIRIRSTTANTFKVVYYGI